MSETTLLLLRVGFLVLLWVFVFIVLYSLRSDLFGARTRLQRQQEAAEAAAAPRRRTPPPPSASPTAATTVTDLGRPRAASAPASDAPPSRLVVTGGPRSGIELDLPSTGLTIGRASSSGLQVKDDYTSSNHARLSLRGSTWYLEDLGSTNGTFAGGKRVTTPAVVRPGTELRVGTTTFELRR